METTVHKVPLVFKVLKVLQVQVFKVLKALPVLMVFDGAQGAAGSDGNDGAQGAAGIQGAQGATGAGIQGAQGAAGSDGNDGAQGAAGSDGIQGAQGAAGAAGSDGSDGAQGAAGSVSGGVAYGEIFEVGGSAINVGTSYQGWNTATLGEINEMSFTPGGNTGGNADSLRANTGFGGVYQIQASYTLTVGSNATVTMAVFLDGVEVPTTTTSRAFSNNSTGSFSITDLVQIEAGSEVDIRLRSDQTSTPVTPVNISFNVSKLVGIGDQGAQGDTGLIGAQGATRRSRHSR